MSINLWYPYYSMSSEYWSTFINGTGNEFATDVACDYNRAVYVSGATAVGFSNVHFGSSYNIYSAIHPFSGYAVKYNVNGDPLLRSYISNINTYTNQVTSNSIAVASSLNYYVCGSTIGFSNSYDAQVTTLTNLIPRYAGYVAKYDQTGTFQWRAYVSNTFPNIATSNSAVFNTVALDASENVYVAGSSTIGGTGAFSNIYSASDGYPNSSISSGFPNTTLTTTAFLVKFNSLGVFQWRVFASLASTLTLGLSCATDSLGNVYFGGQQPDNATAATFFTTAPGATSAGLTNVVPHAAFLVKYNGSGNILWHAYIDDPGSASLPRDTILGIATDSANSVYVSGATDVNSLVAGTINFYNSNIYGRTTTYNITGAGQGVGYLAKYSSSGVVLWRAYIDSAAQVDFARSVAVDADQNVIICGNNGPAVASVYDARTLIRFTIPSSSGFVIKFNPSGYIINRGITTIGAPIHFGVTTDDNRNIIIAGTNSGTINSQIYNSNVDSTSLTTEIIPNGSAYVIKYNSDGIIAPLNTFPSSTSNGWVIPLASNIMSSFFNSDTSSIYICGNTSGAFSNISSSSNVNFSGTSIPQTTSFVSKFDSDGNFQWRRLHYSTGNPLAYAVTGNSTNIYVGGSTGTADCLIMNTDDVLYSTIPANSGFIVRYDQNGGIQSTAYVSNSTITSMYYSNDNNLYLTGFTSTTLTANIISSTNTVLGTTQAILSSNSYVIKMAGDLNSLGWTDAFLTRGTAVQTINNSVYVSPDNFYVYVAGTSGAAATRYQAPGQAPGQTLLTNFQSTGYIFSINASNGAFIWDSVVDAATSVEGGNAVIVDSSSNVYFAGNTGTVAGARIYDTIDNPFSGNGLPASAGFLIKYDVNGNLIWSSNISTGVTTSNCLTVDSGRYVYVGGKGGTSAVIGHSNVYGGISSGMVLSANDGSAFVAKYEKDTGLAISRSYIDGGGIDISRGLSTDSYGYIYMVGRGGAAVSTVFNSNAVVSSLQAIPLNTGFLVKYKPSGTVIN